jgi:hypothetical protein
MRVRRWQIARLARTTVVAVLAAALAALALATAAAALIVPVGHGRAISYQPLRPGGGGAAQPFDLSFHNVDYNGGRVMPSNANYAFFWDPPGAPAYPADYQPGLEQFFIDLANDSGGRQNVDSVATQYGDYTGAFASYSSSFAGAIVDTDPYPGYACAEVTPACLSDAEIRQELGRYLKAHGLPMDLEHEYFVLLPPGVESCFGTSNKYCSAGSVPHAREAFCAYHGAAEVEGGTIVYADDPYAFGGACDDGNHPNGTTADATIAGGLSHEHDESLTDPVPNRSWTDWASGVKTGYEIGDKCRTFEPGSEYGTPLGTASNGASYNQLIDGHPYWLQQEWSNQGHACMQRYTPSGTLPTASFTWTAGSEEFTADASASSAEGGVSSYEWQPGEYEGQVPTTTCGAGPPGPVCKWGPVKGIHHVALTVFASDGASAGTARWMNVGTSGLPVVTKVAPIQGPAAGGTKVTIDGSEFLGSEETAVAFGGVPATSVTVVSATKLTAYAPAHAAGIVDVTVSTPFGASAHVAADRYRYTPAVKSVTPASGPRAGGTAVTVKGAGFVPGATSFKVGLARATGVTCASPSECTLHTPRAAVAGTVDVVATVAGASSRKTAGDRFTYT